MNIFSKKLINGFEIPVVALGTWEMGGRIEKEMGYNPKNDIETIQKAYELGLTRFDTAEVYANGYSEEILGQALAGIKRSNIFVTSKVKADNLCFDDLLASAENSLKRLKMNYLDLYLIHAPNHNIPISETMKALDKLKADGMIKNIGISNFSVDSMKEAQENTDNNIVLNQVHYNLMFREPELAGVLEYCQKNDIFLEAWRPIQQGNLSKPGIKTLDEMSSKYNKTQSQTAINWLISQKNVITLFKTSNLKHLEENLGALNWGMEQDDIELLSKEFPIQLDRSNAVQLR